MADPPSRFPWAALLLGLILGAAGGLAYAWFLNPVTLIDIAPHQLVVDDQRAYLLLISESYLYDHDLDRAQARLATLRVRDAAALLSQEADRALLNGADPREVRALAALAEGLGASPMAAEVFSGTDPAAGPAITPTITATFEGIPTLTPTPESPTAIPTWLIPTPTATPDFLIETEMDLIALETICEDEYPAGRIEVYVADALERGIPGVRVLVEWEGKQDSFLTGLKPEIDRGYGDFQMEPSTVYTVTLVDLAEPVVGIDSSPCLTPAGVSSTPTYRLIFAPAPLDANDDG